MSDGTLQLARRRFLETSRADVWWLQPLIVLVVFSSFVGYVTWAAFQGVHYHHHPYLSPLYAPELFGDSPHAWFGKRPGFWPEAIPYSPAFLILWMPAMFRFTCYYYRGAYYKAFWADPPACTVGEPRKKYLGERSFPLVLQNVHRYFMYLALPFLLFLTWDVWKALWFIDPATGQESFGVGVGTLVLAMNAVLLAGYTFGCHSLRHWVGGGLDRMWNRPIRRNLYACAGCFNRRHALFAWLSLFWVAFSDLYVRLCSMGVWTDWRIV